MDFLIFSIWYNVKFYTVLTPKMLWEPLNCGSFLDKIYMWLHENVLEISLKIVNERIQAFKSRGTRYLKRLVFHDQSCSYVSVH